MMVIYKNNSTDPYFNLASEQYLLDTKDENIFMLWRNSPAVIIGKNQNAYAELDVDYVEKNKIKVVRRLTGGGAVFHDTGNVNFTFITRSGDQHPLDFAKFTEPIINALKSLGAENVYLSGRNDIMLGDVKISGNAQTSYNGRTLHHGTLLYSADLSMLAGALKTDPDKIRSKGIKSIRNRVGNIKNSLSTPLETEEFMEYIENYVSKENGATVKSFTENDVRSIQKLTDEKYSTWDWNYGRSKDFSAQKRKRYDFGSVSVNLSATNGIIEQIKIYGDFFGTLDVSVLEESLTGVKLAPEALRHALNEQTVKSCIAGMQTSELVSLILS